MKKVKSILIFVLLGLTTAVVVVSLLVTLFLPTLLRRFACAPYGIRCAAGQAKIHLHLSLTSDLVIQHLTVFEQDGRGVVLQARRLAVTLERSEGSARFFALLRMTRKGSELSCPRVSKRLMRYCFKRLPHGL